MLRGEIYKLRSARGSKGHEQQGVRYGVLIQADELMSLSTALVAPTSTRARAATFRSEVSIKGTKTKVLVEQTGAVHLSRLGEYVDRLDQEEMDQVNQALALVLGLR